MLKTFTKGGIHPEENKLSEKSEIQILPLPEKVYIPFKQHIGIASKPLIGQGDKVKVGQIIAETSGFVSTNIHSSVSGTIEKIDRIIDISGFKHDAFVINIEGDIWNESIDKTENIKKEVALSTQQIIQKVLAAGIVGLGGATFPSHVKLSIPKNKKINYLIINGVECEPYLTADHRLMLEKGEQILIGTQIIKKVLNVDKVIIGIENNKPDAIQHLTELSKKYSGITIQGLKVKYPQGGEKQLIKALINKQVPTGGLPMDVGAVVFNAASTYAVYEAVQNNKPLVERVVTVTGKSVKKPSNFWVRLGTPISHLIDAANGLPKNTGKIIIGGPMMGRAISNIEAPIVKGSSGITIISEDESKRKEVINCIRCAQCLSVCPMGLEPYLLMPLIEKKLYNKSKNRRILDCIECGSCSYICPSNRPLLDYIRLGKSVIYKLNN